MRGAKVREVRRAEAGRLPPDAARLLDLILKEIRSPADAQKVFDEMPACESCVEEARRFLKAKDRATRREAYLANERLWFNKYGWFMARVVSLFGLIVFALFFALGAARVDFVTGLLLGAAGYYLLLVTVSNVRYREGNRKRRRQLEEEGRRYQREIVGVAGSLLGRFKVEPAHYPVKDPRSPAGLSQQEDGYFIPLD